MLERRYREFTHAGRQPETGTSNLERYFVLLSKRCISKKVRNYWCLIWGIKVKMDVTDAGGVFVEVARFNVQVGHDLTYIGHILWNAHACLCNMSHQSLELAVAEANPSLIDSLYKSPTFLCIRRWGCNWYTAFLYNAWSPTGRRLECSNPISECGYVRQKRH